MSNSEIKKIKPKFFGDVLWFYPALMLIMGIGFSIFMWRLSGSKPYWPGLSVIMNILIQPIFFLLWLDNLSNRAIFEKNQLILKGFLHKKKIEYKNIRSITFSDLDPAALIYFNPKLNKNRYIQLFIWNHSINILIDEIKKRANIKVNGYPDKINRRNFYGKIWFLVIMALTIGAIDVMFWQAPELKPQYKNITNQNKIISETK
ncbi:MAG: hypothetical protein PHC97_02265 [Patescibacteria group bacterium]|nr:hypothetical protein [Patescibacteria group bacterium]